MLSGTSKEYYEDGQTKEIANYENNVLHGERLAYSEEGQLLLRYTYKHGAADGPFEEFDFRPYRKKADGPYYIKKGVYKDGLLISEVRFEPDGRVISTELYEYEDRKITKKTTNYQSDKSMSVTIYNNGLEKYEDFYDSEKNFVKRLNYDSLGRINSIMKTEGDFKVIYDISEKQILGKWSADGNFYNADGKKIGHAGPDGKLILEEQSPSNQMNTRKSK
jgi:antitoxin component YwqK of YwqJK toxin-antitoxin module